MRRSIGILAAALLWASPSWAAETLIKIGWAAPVVSAAATPYAVAQQMGWFAEEGIKVQLVPLPGSTDVVKQVATGDLTYGFPSPEPVTIIRAQGVKAKTFYTAFQGNVYGMAVTEDSPIKTFTDLKGKTIGVTSMGSAGVVVGRALVAGVGLNPDTDVRMVVVGEAGQAAAMVRNKQVDALSQFDTAYAMIESAGVKLRYMDKSSIEHFPSNGLFALEKTLVERRAEAVGLGRALAKGTIFVLNNPEKSIKMFYQAFPQLKPTGMDEATAEANALRQLRSVIHVFPLEQNNVKRWGEANFSHYDNYAAFLVKWGVAKEKVPGTDLATNDLIDDINKFDAEAIVKLAKAP